MRIPGTRVYRAFPELDRFSDADCRRFVRFAAAGLWRGWKLTARVFVAVLTAPAIAVGFLAGLFLWSWVVNALGQGRASLLWIIPFCAPAIGVALLPNLLLRDWQLRREITSRIFAASCSDCRYSLLGLEWRDGLVNCPECGKSNNLGERGLKPQDLMASRAGAEVAAASSVPPEAGVT